MQSPPHIVAKIVHGQLSHLEARGGIEPPMRALQAPALALGYRA